MSYKKQEEYSEAATESLKNAYRTIITDLGEDANREGLEKTPERVAKAMQYLTQGYQMGARAILESANFMKHTAKWSL